MKTVEVVAAVVKEGKKILATQRGYGEFKGKWEFPGGKIEKGEKKIDALKREIKEELDVDIDVGELIITVEHDYPDFHLTMHTYLSKILNGEIDLLEHMDMKWLELDEIDQVDWLEADIYIVEKLKKM